MKKIGIVLLIVSIIALFVLLYMQLAWWNDGSRRASFMMEWSWFFLFPLILPIMGRNISIRLAIEKPRIWVMIQGAIALIWILVQVFAFSFIERTMDLQLCINRNYSAITVTAQTVSSSKNAQTVVVGEDTFKLKNKNFYSVTQGETYKIIYLPNSKYVIEMISEDTGHSLLKKR